MHSKSLKFGINLKIHECFLNFMCILWIDKHFQKTIYLIQGTFPYCSCLVHSGFVCFSVLFIFLFPLLFNKLCEYLGKMLDFLTFLLEKSIDFERIFVLSENVPILAGNFFEKSLEDIFFLNVQILDNVFGISKNISHSDFT